jgi:CheY-like chemotaxis protein
VKRVPTILYIDDELFYFDGVIAYLSQYYHIISKSDGDAALDYLAQSDHLPDLIVLDIMLQNGEKVRTDDHGRTAGLEFARIVLEQRNYVVPIVCYTVITDPSLHDKLLEIGVKQIVSKRKLPVDLKIAIDKWILPIEDEA